MCGSGPECHHSYGCVEGGGWCFASNNTVEFIKRGTNFLVEKIHFSELMNH